MSRTSPASALAWRSAVSKVFCRSSPLAAAADAGQHQHQRGFALPRRGEQPRFDRHLVAVIGGDGQRLRAVVVAGLARRSARRTARRGRRPLPARATGRSRSSRGRRGWRRSACRADRPARRPAAGRGSDADRRRASARPVRSVSALVGSARAPVCGGSARRLGGGGAVFERVAACPWRPRRRAVSGRQFAERVALDRRQRGTSSAGADAGNGTTFTGGGTRRAPGARRGTPAVRRAVRPAAPARRVRVSSLMRATSRQTPKPR